ncbi:hypothetical protein A4X09_0g6123 [Tilletia walkeri]|uniref:Muskelin N-terminal domain-containing protein n=1 Tax=Tilletia walkeri TaxID=117179 RepID=A0A8X7N5X8_9BASI|nr:hypothetical protein A4X09_0g6123 [Tilletia walkeri]
MMPVSAAHQYQQMHASAASTAPASTGDPTLIDLDRLPNTALTYTITDASSYLSDFHPSNILLDEPNKVNSRWAAGFVGSSSSFNNVPMMGIPAGAAAASALSNNAAASSSPSGISHGPSGNQASSSPGHRTPTTAYSQATQIKHYLLLRLSSPAVLRSIRFGKYHKSHATAIRDFKVYAGPTRHAASMTRVLRDSCRDDGKPQDFTCRYTDEDGMPFAVRYIRIEPLNSHGVHYNISIWHLALFGISNSQVVQSVQQEYELHRDTKSTRLILKHLRARAHQSAFRALLASSNLGSSQGTQECLTSGVKRLRNNAVVGRGMRPFEHPLLSNLFRALIRRDAWEDVERILDLAAFGRMEDVSSVEPMEDEEEIPSDRQTGKQRAVEARETTAENEEDGEVLFAHFVSRTVPRSVWTAMPVRRALPSPSSESAESTPPATSSRPSPALLIRNAPSRPGPRAGHQMIFDSTKSIAYLFGGWDGTRDLADFWAYDVERATWRCISMDTSQPAPRHPDERPSYPYGLGTAGPIARSCHRMVFDPRTGCIYLLGRFVEFPSSTPAAQSTTVAQPQPQTAAAAAAASSNIQTSSAGGPFQGNQVFQDVMIPSTNLLRSQIAPTANPGTPSNPAIARPASTAGLHSSAQLSSAASNLASSPSMNNFTANSTASSPGGNNMAPGSGGASRLSAGAGSRTGPGAGSSSLSPSPAPGASGNRNFAGPGGGNPGTPGGGSGPTRTGADQPSSAQAHSTFGQRASGADAASGLSGMYHHSRTLPGYECDFWRFSTRTETWTRLSADTSLDDGKGTGSPGPRLVKDHAMCFDSEEQALYLFGGKIAHPNPSVVEYGGMWRYDIIRRTWSLLFDDDTHFCVPGREGHSMLLDPNLGASSGAGAGAGNVMGIAAALSASLAGPGPLLWIIGGKRDLFLADMWTYNVRTGGIMHVTSSFNIPYGPKPSFTPQVMMDPRPHKREIYFLCAAGDGELGASGDCTSLKMWVYSMKRQAWTSVLEPEPASTNAVLAAAAEAGAGGRGAGIAGGSRPHIRIGPAGAGFEMDSDEYGSGHLRSGDGTGSSTPMMGGSGAAPKRQRRRDTLESEYEADEDARARLMLSSPPPSGPLNALPFPSTSARRDEAMMMLMETDGEFGEDARLSGGAGVSSGGIGVPGGAGDGMSSLSSVAVSADLYAGLEPRPRWASQMVYDPLREAFYLFGGNPNGAQVVQPTSSSNSTSASGQARGGNSNTATTTDGGRVRSRLDDWWRLVLVRPSVEEVLRKTKFLVRKQRFLEMAAGTWEQPMVTSAPAAPMDLEMSATEGGPGGFLGGGGGWAGPRAVEALIYLQTQVSAVVDHADEAESHDFRRLMSKLLSSGGSGGPSVFSAPAFGSDTPTPFSQTGLGEVGMDGSIGAVPSHRSSGRNPTTELSPPNAHRRKMRKKNEKRKKGKMSSTMTGARHGLSSSVHGDGAGGAMSMDVDTDMMSVSQQHLPPAPLSVTRGIDSSVGAEEEEDELEDEEGEEDDEGSDEYDEGSSESDEEEVGAYASERELLVDGREGQTSALWTQRVRLFRTLMDYFPPDCVEPRADLVDLTVR